MMIMMTMMAMIFCRVLFVLMRREKRAEWFALLGPTVKTVGFSSRQNIQMIMIISMSVMIMMIAINVDDICSAMVGDGVVLGSRYS